MTPSTVRLPYPSRTWHQGSRSLRFKDYFGFPNSGPILGTINGLMTIGNFCGAPFLALGDVIGRRGVNFAGNIIVIIAALLQGLAPNLACLMVGRFLLGFGSSMASAPQYVAEVAPLHLRGRLVGFFGTFFQFGSVLMIGAMTGFTKCKLDVACVPLPRSPSASDNSLSHIGKSILTLTIGNSNYQWRIPLILEAFFPVLVCSLIYFLCPESPRYLILKGRR